MSAIGGKADIILGKADIKKCPLVTQSRHAPFRLCSFIRYDALSGATGVQ
jgi:hypothetical protein